MRTPRRLAVAVAVLALAGSGAKAQASPPGFGGEPPQAVGAEPATTTASYGDWVLRCQAMPAAAARKWVCEAVQTLQVEKRPEPLAQVAFGKADGPGELHLVVALPVNIALPSVVSVADGGKDPHPLDLAWKRCIPGACFADARIGVGLLGVWRSATAPGRVLYKDASSRDVVLPLSFRGLGPALDALGKAP